MGFIARNLITNEVFYSRGANKISNLIGCNYSTITKHFQKSKIDKCIKGFIVSKTIDLLNKDRGSSTKSIFNAINSY